MSVEPILPFEDKTLKRRVEILGGYDLRREKPSENYGIHGTTLIFSVTGPEGAVSITFYTNWFPLSVRREKKDLRMSECHQKPWGVDISIHSYTPKEEGDTPNKCDLLSGDCCYNGGSSSLYAGQWEEGFICGGTHWLWPRLEDYYNNAFHDGPLPDLTPILRSHPKEKEKENDNL